jgi:hypothetical protein
MNRIVLVTFVLCFSAAPAFATEAVSIQALELLNEKRISLDEFRALVKPSQTYDSDQVTDANYPSQVTDGNYPDQITEANYPDQVTNGNYPDQVTDSTYPSNFSRQQMEKLIPSPKVQGQ